MLRCKDNYHWCTGKVEYLLISELIKDHERRETFKTLGQGYYPIIAGVKLRIQIPADFSSILSDFHHHRLFTKRRNVQT